MKVQFWPSGHSNEYSSVYLFSSREDALKNEGAVKQALQALDKVSSGGGTYMARMGGAYLVHNELEYEEDEYDEGAKSPDRVVTDIEHAMIRLGAKIAKWHVGLAIRLPKLEEVALLDREEIEFAKFARAMAVGVGRPAEGVFEMDAAHFSLNPGRIMLVNEGRFCGIDTEKLGALEVWLTLASGERTLISKSGSGDEPERGSGA